MKTNARQPGGPQGGLQIQSNAVRRWRWSPAGVLRSVPVRCKREQWYLARGFPSNGLADDSVNLQLCFLREGETVCERRVELSAVADADRGEALLGWVQAPEDVTHMQVCLPEGARAARCERLLLHPIAERDPKCHPLASVPRWASYRPPFPLDRVVLPASLEALAGRLPGVDVDVIAPPRSLRKLAAKVIGAACVIDGEWVRELGLGLADLERVAAASWMIVDLRTFSELMNRAASSGDASGSGDAVRTKTITHRSEHEIMSARVEYADVPTRGFALQDVFPYATFAGETAFQCRVLHASAAWKRYAAETGFATLLASETPWERKCGDVFSAARPIEQGELIVTDLPWLVAGCDGRLLAPSVAEHALRMHLGGPIADCLQYWNRWDNCRVMLRDIGELPRRYPPLRVVRWAPGESGIERLGVTLPVNGGAGPRRHLMIHTGRIDQRSAHDGVPPEPMAIFMKWLVREVREQTRWARRYLERVTVTWQFDTADDRKYAVSYESAEGVATGLPVRTLLLEASDGPHGRGMDRRGDDSAQVLRLPASVGVFGDRSLAYQAELTKRLRRWIEDGGA